MRRLIRTLLFATGLGLIAACDGGSEPVLPPEPPDLTVSPTELRLITGDSARISATVGGNAGPGPVGYTSTDTTVARVTLDGVVVAGRSGTAAIVVEWLRDPRAAAQVLVYVVAAPPPAPPSLAPAVTVADVGQSFVLAFTPGGSAAANFRSADTAVAIVAADGRVTARAPGTAVIIAEERGDRSRTATAIVTVRDPARPALYLSPNTAVLYPGQQLALVPTLAGRQAVVRYRSADPSVVSVSPEGVVRARGAGVAVVSALLQADTTVRAFSVVRVVGPEDDVALAVGSLTDAAGNAVDPAAVRDNVVVRVEVTPGRADSLEVLVGDRVVPSCTRMLVPPPRQPRSFECAINTAEYDTLTGSVRFPNGRYPITVRLLDEGRVILAAGAPLPLNFTNPDRFLARLVFSGALAQGSGGQFWRSGSVEVTALPVLYSRGTVDAFAVALTGFERGRPVTVARTDTDAADGLRIVFDADLTPAEGGLRGLNTGVDGTVPRLTGAIVGGQGVAGEEFANAATLRFRLDNERPLAGTLALASASRFVGAGYAFGTGYIPGSETLAATPTPTQPDAPYGVPGVNQVQTTFFAAPAATVRDPARITSSEIAGIVRRDRRVQTGADLTETAADTAYVLVAAVSDALGNTAYAALPGAFGVDLTIPELSAEAPTDSINPAAPFRFSASDALSGAAAVRLSAVRVTNTGEVCVDLNPATPVCDGLQLAATGAATPFFGLAPGYYRVRAVPVDRAGNDGEPFISRLYLHDPVSETNAPVIGTIQLPTTTGGGQPVEFGAQVRDDADLASAAFRLVFAAPAGSSGAGTFALPLSPGIRFGGFGLPIADSVTARTSFPFLRALQFTDEGGAPNPARLWPTSALQVQATDVAGNRASRQVPVSPPATDGLSKSIRAFAAAATGDRRAICVSQSGCGGVPGSVQLTAVVTGPSGAFTIPFDRVYFFYTDRTGTLQMLGAGRGPVAFDNTTTLTWTYSATLNAAALAGMLPAPGASTAIFALGVDPQGDALLSDGYSLNVR